MNVRQRKQQISERIYPTQTIRELHMKSENFFIFHYLAQYRKHTKKEHHKLSFRNMVENHFENNTVSIPAFEVLFIKINSISKNYQGKSSL